MHGLLSSVRYPSIAGTAVDYDFVEFPAQIYEHWMRQPEVLGMFARHYETGEPIPQAVIDKINASATFDQGFATVEYMAASYLDMAYHVLDSTEPVEPRGFEDAAMADIGLIEEIIPRYRSGYFQHIFSGGYSSGYYSYIWSEILDADAFMAFQETDILDRETAARYREEILSKGGTRPGMELYRNFRGRDPEIGPLQRPLSALSAGGWVGAPGPEVFDDLLSCLTKQELHACAARSFPGLSRSLKKADLVALVGEHCDAEVFIGDLEPGRFLVQRRTDWVRFLLFLYFGECRDGLSRFTMRDMGLVRTHSYGGSYEARFSDREEALETYFFARRLREFDRGTAREREALLAGVPHWPGPESGPAAQLRDQLAFEMGRALEKSGQGDQAMNVYEVADSPQCRERTVRLLFATGRAEDARARLEACLDQPRSDEEWFFASDLYQQKFGRKRTSSLTDTLRAADTIDKMNVVELYPPGMARKVMQMLRSSEHGGVGRLNAYPMVFMRQDGEVVEGNLSAAIISDAGGKEIATVGSFVDLKERLEMERALRQTQEQLLQSEKLAAMGRLTSQIAHELNNPLYGIMNTLELLKTEISPESKRRKVLEMALSETVRLSELLRKMLSFSKPDQEEKQPVDINTVLDEILLLHEKQLQENDIKIKTNFAQSLPKIRASKNQLRQVFLNLVSNARDAMPKGGTLSVETSSGDENIEIKIADTGVGIEDEHISKIFDSFFTTKDSVKGVGLGLSVCYGFIKDHGGDVQVQSQVGTGTTFEIKFPILQEPAEKEKHHTI